MAAAVFYALLESRLSRLFLYYILYRRVKRRHLPVPTNCEYYIRRGAARLCASRRVDRFYGIARTRVRRRRQHPFCIMEEAPRDTILFFYNGSPLPTLVNASFTTISISVRVYEHECSFSTLLEIWRAVRSTEQLVLFLSLPRRIWTLD